MIDAADSEEGAHDTSNDIPICASKGIIDFHPQAGIMMHVVHIHDGYDTPLALKKCDSSERESDDQRREKNLKFRSSFSGLKMMVLSVQKTIMSYANKT